MTGRVVSLEICSVSKRCVKVAAGVELCVGAVLASWIVLTVIFGHRAARKGESHCAQVGLSAVL